MGYQKLESAEAKANKLSETKVQESQILMLNLHLKLKIVESKLKKYYNKRTNYKR